MTSQNPNLKILMLTTQLGIGGAEKVFVDHIHMLSKFYDVKVCLFTKQNISSKYNFENELFELDDHFILNVIKRWKYRSKKLNDIIRQHKIDVCISHMEGPNFLSCLTRNKNIKKICVVHGSLVKDNTKSANRKVITNKILVRWIYNKADKVIGVSKGLVAELVSFGVKSQKCLAINNYFNLEKIQKLSHAPFEMKSIMEEYPFLINVGRLSAQKNQKPVLQIYKKCKEKNVHLKLVIVGDGELRQELINFGNELGLSIYDFSTGRPFSDKYDVYFTGAQTNPYTYMSMAHFFLLTSYFEGFPLVLGESLACGLPVLAVDCSTGPREILSDDGSFIPLSLQDPELLSCGALMPDIQKGIYSESESNIWSNLISQINDNPAKYRSMKEACTIRAGKFSETALTQTWIKLINNINTGLL